MKVWKIYAKITTEIIKLCTEPNIGNAVFERIKMHNATQGCLWTHGYACARHAEIVASDALSCLRCVEFVFSCPDESLTAQYVTLSLTDWLTESHFWFHPQRAILETYDLSDIWSELWGDMTRPKNWNFFGTFGELFLELYWNFLELFWNFFGTSSGTFWKLFGNFSGNLLGTFKGLFGDFLRTF